MANTVKKKKKQSEGNEQTTTLINKVPEIKHLEYTKEHVWAVVEKTIAVYKN